MAKGFAINNSMTNHGGIIQATQQRTSQMGNLFLRAGDGHFCPKCKCWSTIQPSHNHIIMDRKPVAYTGDRLTCGATIQPKQSHVVGTSQGKNYRGSSKSKNTNSFINQKNEDNWITYQFNDGFDYKGMPCTLYFKNGEKLESFVNENNILEFRGFSNDDFDYLHFIELQRLSDDTCFSDELLKKI